MDRKNKRNISIVLIILAIAFVLFIGFNIRGKSTGFLFDESLMKYINSKTTDSGVKGMKIYTNLGSKYFFIIALLGLVIYYINKRKRRNARLIFISIAGSYGINAVLKILFSRVRPLEYMLVSKSGYSFPSGHAMVSMSFYSTMTYILLERVNSIGIKVLAWVINFLLIFSIGFSRLYLGVHWPTDILTGFVMGFVIFYVSKENIKN